MISVSYRGFLGFGYHYAALLEYSVASGTTTWIGSGGVHLNFQSGIDDMAFV